MKFEARKADRKVLNSWPLIDYKFILWSALNEVC
jgi:hypothetical protein